MTEPNSKTTGDLTETKVLHELVARGCNASIPFGDNAKYDLVVEDETGTLHRLQCKTGWWSERGNLRFNTHSQTTRDGEYHETDYEEAIDAFVVRDPREERLYWVDIAEAPTRKMDLNPAAAIDHPAINWAADYELGDEIPPRRP
ncbi:MAG: group I intron-associated PD-(D/E)XK endonuclease [Halobacteriales archaeon]|nr:group I intron-associated PD-(D/E)XK endonuclease [Halobacteriales archaeon]